MANINPPSLYVNNFEESNIKETNIKYILTHCSYCERKVVLDTFEEARMYAFTPYAICPWGDACVNDPKYRHIEIIESAPPALVLLPSSCPHCDDC